MEERGKRWTVLFRVDKPPQGMYIRSYIQELSMHSVSTVQCELVCFSVKYFTDPVTIKRMTPIEGTNWVIMHDLELFSLLVRCLLGFVVWYV